MKVLRDDQLNVFWMSRIDYEKNTGVKSHFHDDLYQFIYLIDGEGTMHINDEVFDLLPKHAYFISKGDKHRFYFTSHSSTIDLKFDVISQALQELFHNEKFPTPYFIGESPKLKELFKLSIRNIQKSTPIIPYRIDVGFKDILLAILQDKNELLENDSRPSSTFNREPHPDFPVIEYMLEHLDSRITLEDIAKHFNFHPHYIIDLFRKKFNTTPMKLLQELRIEKSKEYLEFSNYTVTEIAAFVGLSAPYFSRLFQSREDLSPTEYREQALTVVGKHIILEEEFSPTLQKQPKITREI